MKTTLSLVFFFSLFASVSCQTSPQVGFDKISIGSKKADVLALIGGPQRSYFKNDTHRWVYTMQSKSGNWMTKELWLKNDVVVHKEIPPENKPLPSDYEELN